MHSFLDFHALCEYMYSLCQCSRFSRSHAQDIVTYLAWHYLTNSVLLTLSSPERRQSSTSVRAPSTKLNLSMWCLFIKCRYCTKFPQLELTMARSWAATAGACDTDRSSKLPSRLSTHPSWAGLRIRSTFSPSASLVKFFMSMVSCTVTANTCQPLVLLKMSCTLYYSHSSLFLYHEMSTSNGQIQVLWLILHCSQQSALLKSCQLLTVRGIGQKRATCGQFPPEHTLTSLPSGSSAC